MGFRWQPAGNTSLTSGKTLLVGANGPVAILGFYNYVMKLDELSVLIWYQNWTGVAAPIQPVRLLVVRPERLSPLGENLESFYRQMDGDRVPIIIGGNPSAEMSLAPWSDTDELQAEFPEQLQSIDELLILCKFSGAGTQPSVEGGNLALLVARPRRGTYRLYPQDWFNSGALDYGYQWVARVARNPRTGQVHGEGVRIAPFILDDSLRGLRR